MTRFMKYIGVSALAVAMAVLAVETRQVKAQEKTLHLAFVTNNASDFWTVAKAGTMQAVKEVPNIQVDFIMPPDGQAATQKRNVQDILARGVDGMAISPIDPVNQKQFLNDVASQSLLICQDSDAPDTNRACYIGTDNVAAGRQAGELIKKVLPNGGKIMVFVGKADAQNAVERFGGIKEVLKGSNITIIDLRTDDTDRVRAKNNVKDTILKYPDVACLVGLWSYNGPAIYNAVKEAGQAGKIKIVCFDDEDETIAGVKDGTIYATVVQQQFEFGRQAVTLMARYLRGDKSAFPASKKIVVPTLAIDKSQIDEFAAKMKLLKGK